MLQITVHLIAGLSILRPVTGGVPIPQGAAPAGTFFRTWPGNAVDEIGGPGTTSYNADMEYRRCGKTGWMVSAVCLGGHWKRVNRMVPGVFQGNSWLSANLNDAGFQKNRYDVVTRCIERGINYIDACTGAEIQAYSKALEGRREQMYLGWSWYEREARNRNQCNGDALMAVFEDSLKVCKQEYVDLYRIVCGVNGRRGEDGRWSVAMCLEHLTIVDRGVADIAVSLSQGRPYPRAVSIAEVKYHVSSILSKLGVASRTEEVAFALQNKLVK